MTTTVTTAKETKQAPLPSGYGARTTAREVLAGKRLDGRVAVVTGGYAGVGLETTRALAAAGATVVVPARSLEKAGAALAPLIREGARVEIETLDLASPETVDAFAARFLASDRPLHLLINNAGIMAAPFAKDARGFESQLATNHLGHFQLTVRLWPALVRAGGARVVSLSSRGHARAGVDFEDPHFERRPYDKWIAYGQAKTANALFAVALDARGEARGVHAFSVHPGAVLTDLSRFVPEEELSVLRARLGPGTVKTTEEGAATSVWCATSEALATRGGVYCEDGDIAVAVAADFPEPRGVRPWAIDPELAERLWKNSEAWTGLRLEA